MMSIISKSVLTIVGLTLITTAYGQSNGDSNISGQEDSPNVISTAVPFLNISPDSRAGGMGETGAATNPDINSQAWNPAKYAFIDAKYGASFSYTPWLRSLVDDINLYYVSGFYRLDKMQTISASLRYFSVGSILFKETDVDEGYYVKPNEFAIDGTYTRLLSQKFSGAISFRYIYSNLSGGMDNGLEPGSSVAADVAFYYKTPFKSGNNKSSFASGINISNIGSKISYDGQNKEFIPTNLKLGACYSTELDEYNSLSIALDMNKLLVPTPDTTSTSYADQTKDIGVIEGMFTSFSDAPGGAKEEWHEITWSVGAEYWYNKQFALRGGYFYEHETKGNRKYFTAGVGLKFNVFNIDASYIIPVVQNNPLANTIRFTLGFSPSEI